MKKERRWHETVTEAASDLADRGYAAFDSIKGWITEEDFTEPLYRKAAQELFTQYGESGQVNPAKIISRFQEEEEQKKLRGF